jgi:(2Fe-2S) ferredoxin
VSTATVLVGMSIADVDRRDELTAAARKLGATVAFLQLADPSLGGELTRLADAGVETITLVGVDLGPLAPGHSWLRRIAAHWWRERAGQRPGLYVATRLADDLAKGSGAVRAVLEDNRPITGLEPGLTSAAWEAVTAHRHQVMVCRGPRCTANGAADSLRSMVLALMEQGLGDDDVLLVHTGCQLPCNHAPVVSVQPDDVWYGQVDPSTAEVIVAEHLVAGTPVESHRLPRRTAGGGGIPDPIG